MIIKKYKPTKEIKKRIAEDYYLESEKMFGKSLFRKLSLKAIKKGDTSNFTLMVLDGNYCRATDRLNNICEDFMSPFIGMFSDSENYLIAHTSISLEIAQDGDVIAKVDDIYIKDKEQLSSNQPGSLNFVLGIYREMIRFIEDFVASSDSVLRIDIVSLADDGNFWEIIQELGYDVTNSSDVPNGKCRFSKYIKERPMTYERRNSNQQNN